MTSENAETQNLLAQFLASWTAGSAEPRSGVPEAELTKFEERHCVRLPVEFKTYLRRANGMQQDDMDSERLIRFYGIDEILRAPNGDVHGGDHAAYFVFADFMIGSHEYAIALVGPHYGEIAIVDDTGPPRPVANSFVDFMTKYVHSPDVLSRGRPR